MFSRIREFLALRRSMIALLSMAIFVGMGEKMAERFLPIYLLALGGGIFAVGLLNGLDNLLSAVYSWVGGLLSDRLGPRKALLLFNVMAAIGFLIVILVPRWEAVILGAFFFLSWTALSLPATMSMIAKHLPRTKRTMGVSMHSLVRRIPMALGPLIGGFFIVSHGETTGVRMAFVAALSMAVLSIFIQRKLIPGEKHVPQATPRLHETWRAMNPNLKHLLVSDILIRFCEQIPYAFVVIWCMKTIDHPVSAIEFGFLTAIEMATAVLIYIPVAAAADRAEKKPFVLMTFVNFTLFPLILLFSHSLSWLIVAFIVRGLKEFGEAPRKALIMDLAPRGREASAFGLYYLVRDCVVSIAAFGGAWLWTMGPAVNFISASLCGAAGTLWFAWKGRNAVVA